MSCQPWISRVTQKCIKQNGRGHIVVFLTVICMFFENRALSYMIVFLKTQCFPIGICRLRPAYPSLLPPWAVSPYTGPSTPAPLKKHWNNRRKRVWPRKTFRPAVSSYNAREVFRVSCPRSCSAVSRDTRRTFRAL